MSTAFLWAVLGAAKVLRRVPGCQWLGLRMLAWVLDQRLKDLPSELVEVQRVVRLIRRAVEHRDKTSLEQVQNATNMALGKKEAS